MTDADRPTTEPRTEAEAAQGAAPRTMSASIPPDLAERWGMCAECSHSPGNHGGAILRMPGKPCYVRACKCPGYQASRGAAPRAEGLDGEALYREWWRMDWEGSTRAPIRQWEQLTATDKTKWAGLAAFAIRRLSRPSDEGAAPRAEGLDVERLIWRLIESYPGGVEIDNVQRFREHVRASLSRPSDERVPIDNIVTRRAVAPEEDDR